MIISSNQWHKSLSQQPNRNVNQPGEQAIRLAQESERIQEDNADDLIAQVDVKPPTEKEISSGPPIIKTQNADYIFASEAGVRGLTFYVPRGVIFGLVGPSGSGKTTTVRLLNGMYKPASGTVQVLDQAPDQFNSKAKEDIGYMPQSFVLYPMLTVWENLNFVASLYGMGFFGRHKRLKNLLTFTELYDARNRLASQLSGGMQRRLQLACALVHNPQLIFADEPTAGIDPILRSKFWDHFRALRDEGHTLFITTQYIGEIEYCDIVGIMREGRMIYIDTPEELRRKAFGGDLLRLVVDSDHAVEAVNLLNNQSIVMDARRSFGHPGLLLVSIEEAASAMPVLIAVLKDHKIDIQQAEKYIPPFDDVFVELMKQSGDGNV